FEKPKLALADGHDIAVMQLMPVDPDGVDEYAVRAAEIFDHDTAARRHGQPRVLAAHEVGEYLNVAARAAADRYRALHERKSARAVAREADQGRRARPGVLRDVRAQHGLLVGRLARGVRHIQVHDRTWTLLDLELQRSYSLVASGNRPILVHQDLLHPGRVRARLLELRARVGDLFAGGFELGANGFGLDLRRALRDHVLDVRGCSPRGLRAKCCDFPALCFALFTQLLQLRPCLRRLLLQQVRLLQQPRDSAVPLGDFGSEVVFHAAVLPDRRSRSLERAREAADRAVFLVHTP